jgi:AcrR family transcriptional regulator
MMFTKRLVSKMGISERRIKEKADMKQAVLDAALSLFIEEGYESVSIRKIAVRIEYSPSTIYLYFKDKDEILFELHNLGFESLYRHQLEVQSIADPMERMMAHGRAYLKFAMEHQEYYDIMFIVRSPSKFIEKYKHWECGDRAFELLIKNVQECIDAGYFKGQNAEPVAFLLWSIVHGMASLIIRKRLILPVSDRNDPGLLEKSLEVLRSLIK